MGGKEEDAPIAATPGTPARAWCPSHTAASGENQTIGAAGCEGWLTPPRRAAHLRHTAPRCCCGSVRAFLRAFGPVRRQDKPSDRGRRQVRILGDPSPAHPRASSCASCPRFHRLHLKVPAAVDQPLVARVARRTITRRPLAIFIDRHRYLQGDPFGPNDAPTILKTRPFARS
jgi:hypothetical protein